jgi:serine/threonine-protein kinase
MGAVFQATHLVTGKELALKCMLPGGEVAADDIERFIREARAAARISHPNIVDIYDVGEHEGAFFLVMEYLRGRSLRELMRSGAVPAGPLLRSLLPALRGVQAAHRAGVVHRDLKPENIFLCCDADGEPLEAKVLDFGISKFGEQNGASLLSITRTGAVMGTPFYMSPEQAEDSSTVDERTDIYAFGVILYEALSGVLPYRAESLTGLLLRIARGDAVPLRKLRSELPGALESAVMRAMAAEPKRRFADVRALIAALEPFASSAPLPLEAASQGELVALAHTARPSAVESRPARGLRTRRAALVGLVGLGLVIAGGVLWRAAQGGPAPVSAANRAPAAPPKPQPAIAPPDRPAAEAAAAPAASSPSASVARGSPSAPERAEASTSARAGHAERPLPRGPRARSGPERAPATEEQPAPGRPGIDLRPEQF